MTIDRLTATRRGVISGGLIAGAAIASPALSARARRTTIVSTWDFGAAANADALARLRATGSPLDAVEAGARNAEADPENHSVGYSGYPDRDGRVTLDAIIMDDSGHCGAVAAMEDIVHAISVARLVMEKTPHVMLTGEGATRFAVEQGMQRTRLLTPASEKAWREWLKTANYQPVANIENQSFTGAPGSRLDHDTIGILALAEDGRMAGACSTSGMAFKMHGRVGDSPQSGCGLFVERGVGAATSTGVGEEVVRICGTARVVAAMRHGASPQAACEVAVRYLARLRGGAITGKQVGFLALGTDGRVGAYALLPGFTYAVTGGNGQTAVKPAASLFKS